MKEKKEDKNSKSKTAAILVFGKFDKKTKTTTMIRRRVLI
jgi:hypothetical protein